MTSRPEPPIELFLHIVSKAARKITVFDLDDAIFLDHPLLTEYFTAKSDLVTVGSHQLATFASKWNEGVHLLPSAVNTDDFSPDIREPKENGGCVLGWHGTAYVQLEYLRILVPILGRLAKRYDITFKLLGTMGDRRIQRMFRTIPGLSVDFGPDRWVPYESLPALIADVQIGLSPLTDSLWSRSKCAMKALEYMSMGMPVVGSPVGEHNYLIRDDFNGLLASSVEEWVQKISDLVEDRAYSDRLGQRARETVLKGYSLDSVAKRFAEIISGG
jgi:glycosyltransferase involved in cell wall biosynthesis